MVFFLPEYELEFMWFSINQFLRANLIVQSLSQRYDVRDNSNWKQTSSSKTEFNFQCFMRVKN